MSTAAVRASSSNEIVLSNAGKVFSEAFKRDPEFVEFFLNSCGDLPSVVKLLNQNGSFSPEVTHAIAGNQQKQSMLVEVPSPLVTESVAKVMRASTDEKIARAVKAGMEEARMAFRGDRGICQVGKILF